MSATTTNLSTLRREVWVQQEGCETVRLFIKSDTNTIEDLKLLGLGDSRKDYHAFYLQQDLLGYYLIPTDVSPQEPIQFKRIKDRRYGPDVADNVNTSRDCLLSTSTNTADGWTFDGLLWRATSSLWRRVTKGHTTSNKSKQK